MGDKKTAPLASRKKTANEKMDNEFWAVMALGFLSLVIRVGFSFYVEFNDDPVRIYAQGLNFYLNHDLSVTGASVVYTGTVLPGSLQALLASLPLFVSSGLPWGLGVFVALLNFISTLVIYRIFRVLFQKIPTVDLAAFLFFAPWTIIFVSVWNPSFLPVFSSLFFWGLLKSSQEKKSFGGAFLIGLTMVCALQLHLSFVLLPLALVAALGLRWIKFPNWKALISGLAVGGVGMIPFFLKTSATHTQKQDFLLRNIEFHWDHFKQWPAFFLRFLSFATGETSHFIGTHHGFGGALEFVGAHPIWTVPSFLVLIGSIALVVLALSFYLSGSRWKALIKGGDFSTLELFRNLALLLPVVTGLLFSFSSQGPSSHTFWILMPLSFFPILFVLEKRRFFEKRRSSFGVQNRVLWYAYCALALVSCLGTYLGVERNTLLGAQSYALSFSAERISWNEVPQSYRPYVAEVLRALPPNVEKSKKE